MDNNIDKNINNNNKNNDEENNLNNINDTIKNINELNESNNDEVYETEIIVSDLEELEEEEEYIKDKYFKYNYGRTEIKVSDIKPIIDIKPGEKVYNILYKNLIVVKETNKIDINLNILPSDFILLPFNILKMNFKKNIHFGCLKNKSEIFNEINKIRNFDKIIENRNKIYEILSDNHKNFKNT